MPARFAIAVVLVAWYPVAAHSVTAASTSCSRRSSARLLRGLESAMRCMLLINLSIVKPRTSPTMGHRMRLALLAPITGLALAAPAALAAIPDTTITSGPTGQSTVQQPEFALSASEPAGFECSLDSAPYGACQSPLSLGPLSVGDHVFRVRGVTADGADATPAERRWSYVGTSVEPPTIVITRPATRRLRKRALRRIAGTASAGARVTQV